MAYMKPAIGAVGAGGAKFGAGSGGDNRFDHTQLYGGLWSIGIDPNSPTLKQDVQNWYNSQPAAVKAEVQKGMGNQPGRGSIDPLVYAVDWRQRDVARKIKKENGFLDSTFGKIVSTALQIGAAAIGGPMASAAVGATIGGISGGIKGAVIGGASGYGIGKGTQWVQGGGLSRTFNTLLGKGATSTTGGIAGTATEAGGYISQLPTASSGSAGGGILSKAAAVFKGASSSLDTAVGAVNAGIGLKQLLAPAGVGAAAYLGASAASTPNLDTTPPPAPEPQKSAYEVQTENERKRRRMTQTDVTWGNVLNDPKVKRPTLLGGATKLAA